MKFILLILGIISQVFRCEAARLIHISDFGNGTRVTQFEVYPGIGGLVEVTGGPDIGIGGPGAGQATMPTSTTLGPGSTPRPTITPPTTRRPGEVVPALECGSVTQMYARDVVQVFSTNFGVAHYQNNEACTWKFEANQCTLSAHCPCADIPRSWECLGDYLKISTDYLLLQSQRFCGGNKPGQVIFSESDFLSVRFRTDSKGTAAGFTCFVRCEGPGEHIPPVDVRCPTTVRVRG